VRIVTANDVGHNDGGPDEGDDALTIGEREVLEGYADFRKELEALPGAAEFQALVLKFGQQFGYRSVARWIIGRPPKGRTGAKGQARPS
jgi:hypothetical protein